MSRVPPPGDTPRERRRTVDTHPHAAYRARVMGVGTASGGGAGSDRDDRVVPGPVFRAAP